MNTVIDPQTAVFNQVEELVGRYPSTDGLRNAIHAVITKSMNADVGFSSWFNVRKTFGNRTILNNVNHLAKNYEASRGIHVHTREGLLLIHRTPLISGTCTEACNRPIVGGE